MIEKGVQLISFYKLKVFKRKAGGGERGVVSTPLN